MEYEIKYYKDKIEKKAVNWYRKNKPEFWLTFGLIILFIGLVLFYIFHNPQPKTPGIVKPDKVIIHDVKVVVDSRKVDSLYGLDSIKTVQIKYLKLALKQAQENNRVLADDTDNKADDYVQDLKDGAAASDTACNEVITALQEQAVIKDSTVQVLQQDKKILISSFNDMAFNSIQKDKHIKKLNKSLRWQKVQKVTLLAGVGYLLIKALTK